MAGGRNNAVVVDTQPRPRCDMCHRSMGLVGRREGGMLCSRCLGEALPFVGIKRVGDFNNALREFREGLDFGVEGQKEKRFNPFLSNEGEVFKGISQTLEECSDTRGGGVADRLRGVSKNGGCSLSLMFHNIRSARGPGLELLEAELRGWGVLFDIVGLAETWLDEASEQLVSLKGYSMVAASRKKKQGGGSGYLCKGRADFSGASRFRSICGRGL